MALTLGFTGMDSSTEAALTAAFQQANSRLGNAWRLASEVDAGHVIVDMDSMYGPMSWLRLHAAGKQVIGLTSAARTQANFHLARPFDADSVAALARKMGGIAEPEHQHSFDFSQEGAVILTLPRSEAVEETKLGTGQKTAVGGEMLASSERRMARGLDASRHSASLWINVPDCIRSVNHLPQ